MTVNLDKSDLRSLVMGTSPSFSIMEQETVKQCGRWVGGHVDRWDWHGGLELLTEHELWDLYCVCRDSWR